MRIGIFLILLLLNIQGSFAGKTGDGYFQVLFTKNDPEIVTCYRIPSIVTALNGNLIVAVDERISSCGDLKLNKDINIVMRLSSDNGNSWSEIKRVVDYPYGQSASDPSMLVDEVTGHIFMFYNYMDLVNEKDVYYFKVISSLDHGYTWSDPVDITLNLNNAERMGDFQFITSGRGIQSSSGVLLHTLVNLQKKGVFVFGSKDHGKSWFINELPIKPADESQITELSNGNWLINSRVNKAGHRYVHISADEGVSWSTIPDSTLIDPGCNAGLIRYRNKNHDFLLFTNLVSSHKRENLCLHVSRDDGKSWKQIMQLFEGSAAYSSITVLKNGDLGVLFERNNYAEIVFLKIKKNDLLKSIKL